MDMVDKKNPYLQFDIWTVDFEPAKGVEINKKRPAVIVSSNLINKNLQTVIIVPLTSTKRNYPCRMDTNFENKGGQLAVDQVRSVDKARLGRKIGSLPQDEIDDLIDMLGFIFYRNK